MRRGDVGRGGWDQLETDGEEEKEMIGRQDGRETEQKKHEIRLFVKMWQGLTPSLRRRGVTLSKKCLSFGFWVAKNKKKDRSAFVWWHKKSSHVQRPEQRLSSLTTNFFYVSAKPAPSRVHLLYLAARDFNENHAALIFLFVQVIVLLDSRAGSADIYSMFLLFLGQVRLQRTAGRIKPGTS